MTANMAIKIYSFEMTPLTQLINTGENTVDYIDLQYDVSKHNVGGAQFSMSLKNPKASVENLRNYNIVEIKDADGTVRWCGLIVKKSIGADTVKVYCFDMGYALKKRLTGANDHFNNVPGATAVTSLLNTTNGYLPTQVSLGAIVCPTSINITCNRKNIFDAIETIADATGYQFQVKPDRKLYFAETLGTDRSPTLTFQYNINLSDAANIVEFDVDDDGSDMATRVFGKSGNISVTADDLDLQDDYGLIEKYENFRELNDLATVQILTANRLQDVKYIPNIEVKPSVPDDFELFDTVRVRLKNRLVDLDETYQITKKSVSVEAGVKRIRIDVADSSDGLEDELRSIKKRLGLIEREV